MSFQTLYRKTIQEAFEEFDRTNPQVYEMFISYFHEALRKKKSKISFKLIMNRIRWEYYMTTKDFTNFKINDAYGSRYARKFLKDFPEHTEKVELRALRV